MASAEERPMKRKLVPQRITFADVCEVDSLAYKTRKVTSTTITAKTIPKPIPVPSNLADWIDTSPLQKSKRKINKVRGATKRESIRKTLVSAGLGFNRANGAASLVQPKKKAAKSTSIVRKELFAGNQNNTRSHFLQGRGIQTKPTMTSPKLDSTEPLINVNDIEAELFPSCHGFKPRFKSNVPLKMKQRFNFAKDSPITAPKRETTVPKTTTGTIKKQYKYPSPLIVFPKVDYVTTTQHRSNTSKSKNVSNFKAANTNTVNLKVQFNVSGASPEENEFIQNERRCKIANYNTTNTIREIGAILHNGQERINNIQQTFGNLQQKVRPFCNGFVEDMELLHGEIQNCQNCHAQDMIKIRKLLETGNGNFEMDKEWSISPAGGGDVPYYSENRSTVKKNVTFNLQANDTMVERSSLEDNGLQKSVHLYNSLRKGGTNILNTPKLNRTSLQTPKRLGSNRRDSVSRRVQKQCLLLLDTPSNKNGKK